MICLLLDIFISSISNYNTSLIIFDSKKHSIIYVIIISLLVFIYTFKIIYILIVLLMYLIKKYISSKYLLHLISYVLLFNININMNNFIIFLFEVLIFYLIPYN